VAASRLLQPILNTSAMLPAPSVPAGPAQQIAVNNLTSCTATCQLFETRRSLVFEMIPASNEQGKAPVTEEA
jgi:hypothetical protein